MANRQHKPYQKKVERTFLQRKLAVHKPGKEVSLHLAGLPKSGKTTMFKQLCFASGFKLNKQDLRMLRYHLIKCLVKGAESLITYCEETKPSILEDYKQEVDLIKQFAVDVIDDQLLRLAYKVNLSEELKGAVMTVWAQKEVKELFRPCLRSGKYDILESFRLLADRLENDRHFFDRFAVKSYLPDVPSCLLSYGWKYGTEQYTYFNVGLNPYLKDANKHGMNDSMDNVYNSRPHLRLNVLRNPLKVPSYTVFTKEAFWRFIVKDETLPNNIPDKDAIVFTVDISAYDNKESAKDDSVVLKKSIQEFVDVAKKGHVAALIFTHIDVFQEKYHTEGIPIDISGKFEGAPLVEEENSGSIALALNYFHQLFTKARMDALSASQDQKILEKKDHLLRVVCVNMIDPDNIDCALKIVLEHYLGFNIPLKSVKSDGTQKEATS